MPAAYPQAGLPQPAYGAPAAAPAMPMMGAPAMGAPAMPMMGAPAMGAPAMPMMGAPATPAPMPAAYPQAGFPQQAYGAPAMPMQQPMAYY